MNKFFTVLLTLATLGLVLPGALADCTPTTSDPEAAAGGFYLDIDGAADGIWIYQESNGQDGLQRGDEMKDDTCGGAIESDTIIF